MSNIHISDCHSFDQNIVISLPCTVHSLLEHIMNQFKYDTTLCSVFQNGKELEFGVKITPDLIKNDNTLILFNQLFFKEKSYTNADQAFNFRQTRFQNQFFESYLTKKNMSKDTENLKNDIKQSYFNYLQNRIYPDFLISQEQEESTETKGNKNENSDNNNNDDDNESNDIESLADLDALEQEAVDRLCSLGFERLFVIQIFMACDRNEEAALELLRSM